MQPHSGFRKDLALGALCALIGVLQATLPHWWNLASYGDRTYISDFDELRCYLPVVVRSYDTQPLELLDPAAEENAPNLVYPMTQFAPAIWIGRACGLAPLEIGLVWRVLGGVLMGLAWYGFFRVLDWRPALACLVSVFLLADAGFIQGKPLLVQFQRPVYIAMGTHDHQMFDGNLMSIFHWRIITPCVSWWTVLLQWGLFAWARRSGSKLAVGLWGVSVAFLIYIYLYYWVAVGLGIVFALALDYGHRKMYWIGGAIGFLGAVPYLIYKSQARAAWPTDWLERTDLFTPSQDLPAMYSRFTFLVMAVILPVIWLRNREYLFGACVMVAGMLLTNHHLVTGISIQNEHWYYVSAMASSILIVVLAVPRLDAWASGRRRIQWAILAVVAIHFGLGAWLRVLDAWRPHDAQRSMAAWRLYQQQKSAHPEPLEARAGILGDEKYVDYAIAVDRLRPVDGYSVLFSAPTTQPDWDARVALNALAMGTARADFYDEQKEHLETIPWGPWDQDPEKREERLTSRMALFDEFAAAPEAAFRKLGVKYVALERDAETPAALASGWTMIQEGPVWNVWKRGE